MQDNAPPNEPYITNGVNGAMSEVQVLHSTIAQLQDRCRLLEARANDTEIRLQVRLERDYERVVTDSELPACGGVTLRRYSIIVVLTVPPVDFVACCVYGWFGGVCGMCLLNDRLFLCVLCCCRSIFQNLISIGVRIGAGEIGLPPSTRISDV